MDNFDDTKELDFKISERIQDNSLNEEKSGERDIFSNHEEINFEDSPNPNKDHDKKIKSFLSTTIGILVFLVVILIVCIVYFWKNGYISTSKSNLKNIISSSNQNNSQLDEPTIKFEQTPEDENQLSAETVYNKLAPCVVGVVVYDSEANIISDPISQGSGVIIDEKGYIVTNSHVVNNSKKNNIKIVSNTNEEFSGKVVGYDIRTDLAVIKCEKSGLSCATLGDSDQVKVGESVLALGNPLGLDFASTLTRGIVSAVNRSKSISSSNSLVKYIQTDAAINPGNSGGPLINMYGQVIGINSMKIGAAGLEGMGFAVPSNDVKKVVSDIISRGYVSGRVRLGISAMQVTAYQSQMYNVPVGILVHKIYSGSSLESANVQNGDIITKINNIDINSFDTFYGELSKHSPGETISLTVFRRKSSMDSSNKDSTTFNVNVVLLEDRGETQEEEQINSRQ